MAIPRFTAEASLYQTNKHYRVSNGGLVQASAHEHVVLALGSADEALCSNCLEHCAENLGICVGIAAATFPFCPPCAAVALAECDTQSAICIGYCHLPGQSCCPEFCHPGKCCGRGETCVDDADPNSRHGCCPSGQHVCGGQCCSVGETCCGNECCPAGWFCTNGFCSQSAPFPGGTPPPPRPEPVPFRCYPGWTRCGLYGCCAPGLECCGTEGYERCLRSCVN
jgi:hypothetical protein